MRRNRQEDKARRAGRELVWAVMLFYFSAFLLLALRDYSAQGFLLAVAVPAMIWLGSNLLPRLFPADRLLLSLTNFLCAMGVLVLYDVNPSYAYRQVVFYGLGIAAMAACVWVVRLSGSGRRLSRMLIPVSLVLLALPLLFGEVNHGAKNWINLAGVSFQPSEAVKIFLLIVLACFMSRRRFWIWFPFAVICLGLLMLQMDMGTALLYYGVTLLMYFASCGSFAVLGAGLAGGVGAAYLGYRMFSHVRRRVAVWRNPWAVYEDAGYQVAQGLMAIASGGLLGVGLGLGTPTVIPEYHNDYIFAVICEQFGLIFAVCVMAMYVALIWRGATVAMAARTGFHGLLAMGATLMLGLQTFVIIGGVIKLIPLTGVTLPFVSSGGTSLMSSMCLIGLIQGVSSLNEDDLREDARLAYLGEEAGL